MQYVPPRASAPDNRRLLHPARETSAQRPRPAIATSPPFELIAGLGPTIDRRDQPPGTNGRGRGTAPQQGRSPPPRPPLTHTGVSSITQMRAFLARRPTSPSSYSTATTLPLCGRIDYSQPAKISTVKAPITAKEPVGDDQGMCADQKIGHDTVARTSTCSVPAPGLRRFNRRLFRHRREGSGQLVHRVPKTSSIAKHCCSLCPDHL